MRLWTLHPRYLDAEARRRGYLLDQRKLGRVLAAQRITETSGQLEFEWAHFLAKLRVRQPARYRELVAVRRERWPRASSPLSIPSLPKRLRGVPRGPGHLTGATHEVPVLDL